MLQPDCFPMNMYGKRSGRHLDRIHFLLIVYSNYKSRSLFRTFSSIPVIRKRKGSLYSIQKRKGGGILSHPSVAARAEPF